MPSLKHRLQFILEGGRVQRFHTRPGIKPDTDAQHSHGVAMICHLLWICRHPGSKPSVELIMGALTHDLAEQAFSDVSSHTKRALKLSKDLNQLEFNTLCDYGCGWELNDEEQHILQLADSMEGLLNACYERALGNTFSCLVFKRYVEYIHEHKPQPTDCKVLTAIISIWEEACAGKGFDFSALKC